MKTPCVLVWIYSHFVVLILSLYLSSTLIVVQANIAHTEPSQQQSSATLTQKQQAWIKQHPIITVGGSPDWTPFNFVDTQGQYSGIGNDYLNLIAQKTGLKFEVSIAQWSINLEMLIGQKIDLLPAVYYTQERSQSMLFSKPYFEALDYFFIRDDLDVTSLDDLDGKRVAIPKSYAHIELLQKHFPNIKIVTVDTFGAAIDAVLENRADMLYDTYAALIYTLEKQGINTIIPFKSTRDIGMNPIHIVSRKNAPILAEIIAQGLNAISQDERHQIYQKWLGGNPKTNVESLHLTPQEQAFIQANPVIIYGAEKDWAPYDFVNTQNKHDGVAKDYLDLISQSSGLQFKAVIDDWQPLLEKIKRGEIDLLPSLYFSQQRSQFLSYTKPYQTLLDYFFIRDDITAQTLADLNGKTIAIPRGFLHTQTIKNDYPQLNILPVDNLMAAVQSVIEHKADILINSHSVISYLLKKYSITTIRPFKALPTKETRFLYMAAAKQKSLLASIINKSIAAIPELKKQQIHSKWFGYQNTAPKPALELGKSEQQWLAKHPRIRFTGDPNWLPYEAFDNQGNYIGIVAEHLKIIEQKLGISIDIMPTLSWSESIDKVKQGEIDVLSETSDSNLSSHLTFTNTYLSSPIVIVMKNDEDYVENITQIKHRKIAVIKEYGYVPKIINRYTDIYFHRVNSIQNGLTAVSTGKVDALLATLAQVSFHISELGINNIRIVGKTEFETQLAFGMSKEFSPLIPLFNRALTAITQTDKQRILKKWGKHKFIAKTDYQLLFYSAAIFLFIIAIIIYWNRKLAKEVNLRKKLEKQTQALIDKIPLPIVVTSSEGHILSANPQTLSDYNIHQDEISQHNILDFYKNQDDRDLIIQEIAKYGRVEQKIIQFKRFDGTSRAMMISIMPMIYNDKNAFLTIAVDMTERLEFEQNLEKTKQDAESANRAKSAFLANMSHEIRTPMNAIIGFTELLNEQITDTRLKSYVNTIQSAGQNLLVLINDILDLSKIESGKLDIEKKPCNPHELLTELGDIFMMTMREKNLDFILDIDPEIPQSLLIDATRLRQVLLNLIGNAVKFTDQGCVKIKAYTTKNNQEPSKIDLCIAVEDTGLGISEDQQELIFQEFQQAKGQNIKQFGGTGLGLSISKRLVEMMQGQLSLSSTVGKGSTFTVKLIGVDILSLVIEPKPKPTHKEIKFHRCEILIVDDIADNRDLLLANFAQTQLRVSQASDGLQAVKLTKQKKFDLILMDIRMPIMDGYQAAEAIKSFSNVPIIALTASVMTNEFEQVRSNNFDGYLRKPVLKANLYSELSKFLAHEEISLSKTKNQSVTLTSHEINCLPWALNKLSKLSEQCHTVASNNNISEIQIFADEVLAIAQQHPIALVSIYAQQLASNIDCFDIAAIKRSLNEFEQLINQLEQIEQAENH